YEATATLGVPFSGGSRTEGILLGDGAVHDPRVAGDGSKRCLAYWAFDAGGGGRAARNEWHLLVFENGRWTPTDDVLRAAGVQQAPSGQPVPYLDGGAVHVVGRAGDEGHLVDAS